MLHVDSVDRERNLMKTSDLIWRSFEPVGAFLPNGGVEQGSQVRIESHTLQLVWLTKLKERPLSQTFVLDLSPN